MLSSCSHQIKMKYKNAFLLALSILMLFTIKSHSDKQKEASAVILVEWDSKESVDHFSRSAHKIDFFPLSNHFVSQENKIFCGLASAAIVLNALQWNKRDTLPEDQ